MVKAFKEVHTEKPDPLVGDKWPVFRCWSIACNRLRFQDRGEIREIQRCLYRCWPRT